MEEICSFFGHRDIIVTSEIKEALSNAIMDIIAKGVTTFYFGGFGDFDELCHNTVSEIRKQNKHIKRIFCLSDERHLRISKRPKYLDSDDYEEFIYLPLAYDYWYTRIYYRNCEMIDASEYVVFYYRNTERSGAYKAYQYAVKTKKKIIVL